MNEDTIKARRYSQSSLEYLCRKANQICQYTVFTPFRKVEQHVETGIYAAPTIQELAKDDIKSNEEECYKTKTFEEADRVRFLDKAD